MCFKTLIFTYFIFIDDGIKDGSLVTVRKNPVKTPAEASENAAESRLREELRRRSRAFFAELEIIDPETVSELKLVSGIPNPIPPPAVKQPAREEKQKDKKLDE